MDQSLQPFFSQENLINMLSNNDVDFSQIGVKKTAIFLIMPDEKTSFHRIVCLFIKQCYELLICDAQKYKNTRLPKRINFLLDEFSALPPIVDFPAMITASRSRNIRYTIIIQSINQLTFRYGNEAETVKSNCNNWIFLTSKELPLLKELSELAGSKNHDEPLISISELQRLDKDKGEAFILHGRLYPFITELPDIDSYYNAGEDGKEDVVYPINSFKVKAVFDFKKYYDGCTGSFLSKLFDGKKHEKEKDYDFLNSDDIIIDPIFKPSN
jgi:type IV secretion system protein VirD4